VVRGGTGKVFTWGYNGQGQLGNGGKEDLGVPGYVDLPGESRGCPYRCRSAQGGNGVTYILLDERKILCAGVTGEGEGEREREGASVGFRE
jgi:alpha-tubulin suppressor-like RCC1 family protein